MLTGLDIIGIRYPFTKTAKEEHGIAWGKTLGGLGLAAGGLMLGKPALSRALKPLYGRRMATLAKHYGIRDVLPNEAIAQQAGEFISKHPLKGRLSSMLGSSAADSLVQRLKDMVGRAGSRNPKAVTADLFSGEYAVRPKGSRPRALAGVTADFNTRGFADDKRNQMALLRELGLGHMAPPTLLPGDAKNVVMQLQRSGKPFTLSDVYDRHFGAGKWLSKPTADTAGFIPGTPNIYSSLGVDVSKFPTDYVMRFLEQGNTGRGPEMLVQGFDQLKSFGPMRKALHKYTPLGKLRDAFFKKVYGGRVPALKDEFRVHVVNGKVIPFATSSKWDMPGYFSPFATARKTAIERQLQGMIDKALASKSPTAKAFDMKNQVFGFDVGLRPDGSISIFEFNPSMPMQQHAGSAQLLFPWTRNAVHSAIKGTMPAAQKLQLGLAGTGLAAGGTMAANGIVNNQS